MQDVISILDAKQHRKIPEYLWHLIPDYCPTGQGGCGAELMTTFNLSRQWCPNLRCKKKLIAMSVKTINKFGYKGVGADLFKAFFEINPKYTSHLAIFVAKPEEFYSTRKDSAATEFLKIREAIITERYSFAEIISKLSLPEVESSALELFEKFSSYQMFKAALDYGNITIENYIKSFNGYGDLRAEKIANTLRVFEKELLVVPGIFNLRPVAKTEFTIAITENPHYHYMTKKDYIKHLNRLGEDIVHVSFTQSALKSCDYIVSYSANDYLKDPYGNDILDNTGNPIITPGTIKKNIGIERNKYEHRKVLVTAFEMRDIILETVRRIKYDE